MRVALVHDWLVASRGGEKVLEALCELYPEADLFTLLHKPGTVSRLLEARSIRTSFLQRVPGIFERYRYFLPLFPAAIEALDLSGYDLILSSSHCVAKAVRKPEGACHLSYIHAPMRYMWDLFGDYFGPGRASFPVRAAALGVRPWLQRWDAKTAQRVDRFVANSHHVAAKVARFYGRQAAVVPQPVDLQRFCAPPLEGAGRGEYFLWVGAPAPYKRLDLAIEAFGVLGRPLWIAGVGQDALRATRRPRNVRILGQVSDSELVDLYRDARALVFTAEEDFGITPLEAQATGRPVIAFGRGGALETVTPRTGLFFQRQTPEELISAVQLFDQWERGFSPADARANASRFSPEAFKAALSAEIARALVPHAAIRPPTPRPRGPEGFGTV